jgi:hypothetical protein
MSETSKKEAEQLIPNLVLTLERRDDLVIAVAQALDKAFQEGCQYGEWQAKDQPPRPAKIVPPPEYPPTRS